MREWYKKKDYSEALIYLENFLKSTDVNSQDDLSELYDLAASILWKMGEKNKAFELWQKSYSCNNNNRHTILSLKMLFGIQDTVSPFFELFVRLKYNEYYSHKKEKNECCCLDFLEEDRLLSYLVNYWEKNLTDKKFHTMDELEVVEYFINLNIF